LSQHAESMHQLIDAHVDISHSTSSSNNKTDRFTAISSALQTMLLKRIHEHGCTLSETEIINLIRSDIRLNTQGLEHWLDQQ